MLPKYMFSTEERIKTVEYYQQYGWKETQRAIILQGKKLSRATLCSWNKRYLTSKREHAGLVLHSLMCSKSRRPHRMKGKALWDERIVNILQQYRSDHPKISKEKCWMYLKQQQPQAGIIHVPSIATIGRIIHSLTQSNSIPRKKSVYLDGGTSTVKPLRRIHKLKKQRRKGEKPLYPGHIIQMDTIEVRVKTALGHKKYYFRTLIDLVTRMTYVKAYTSHTSKNTIDFIHLAHTFTKLIAEKYQTDNGSEFSGEFRAYILQNPHITHYHNYPRSPKQNAFIERFNRTIQEEFINHHIDVLIRDIDEFNILLEEYLSWYLYERPHFGLQLRTPMQVYLQYQKVNV